MARVIKRKRLQLGDLDERIKGNNESKNLRLVAGDVVIYNKRSRYFNLAYCLNRAETLKLIVAVNMAYYKGDDILSDEYYEKYFKGDQTPEAFRREMNLQNKELLNGHDRRTNERKYVDYVFDGLLNVFDDNIDLLNIANIRSITRNENGHYMVGNDDMDSESGRHHFIIHDNLVKHFPDLPPICLEAFAVLSSKVFGVIDHGKRLNDETIVNNFEKLQDLSDRYFTDVFNYYNGKIPSTDFMRFRARALHTFLNNEYLEIDEVFGNDDDSEYLYDLLLDMETLFVKKLGVKYKSKKRNGRKVVDIRSILKHLHHITIENSYTDGGKNAG